MPQPPMIPRMPSPGGPLSRPGCLPVAVGAVLVLLGIPMLICPGPGIGSILLGVSLIAIGLGVRRKTDDGSGGGSG